MTPGGSPSSPSRVASGTRDGGGEGGGRARPGGSRPRRVLRVVGLVAAALVVIQAGILTAVSLNDRGNRETGDPDATGKAIWSLPGISGQERAGSMPGTWLGASTLARAHPDGVIGFDQRTGARTWGLPLPGSDTAVCAVTPDAAGGVVAIGYGEPDRCDRVVAVDADSGEELWTAQRPRAAVEVTPQLALSGGALLVAWDPTVVVAYGARDGEALWRGGGDVSGCEPNRYVGGEALVVTLSCERGGGAAGLDPATGQVRWAWDEARFDVTGVLSTSPPVLVVAGEDRLPDHIVSLDGDGRERGAVPLKRSGETDAYLELGDDPMRDAPPGVVVTDDTLYLPTVATQVPGDVRFRNEVAAFDLATGERRWLRAPGDDGLAIPVRADGGDLVAYDRGTFGRSSRLLRFATDGGGISELKVFEGVATAADTDSSRVYATADGLVFLVDESASTLGRYHVIALS